MTALARKLERLIALTGPITVEHFMAHALSDPEHGYYMRGDPLGRAGDFITAPEISQVFGELLGAWCVVAWRQMGAPDPVAIIELGPGRGTLMADLLRASEAAPGFAAARRLHLVETSPALAQRQRRSLAGHGSVTWHRDIATLPPGPALIIANEFFDALPIRQLVRTEAGWCERLVDIEGDGGGFRFVLGRAPSPAQGLLAPGVRGAAVGSLAEVAPAAIGLLAQLARRLKDEGGMLLIIDYGHTVSAVGETLQAVKGHAPHPVLEQPGEADLTAHVDFAALARAAREVGVDCHGPIGQGRFLDALGLQARIRRLSASATAEQRAALEAARRRLTAEDAMGSLFKVLAIAAPGLPAPAGFEDAEEG